MIGLDIKHDRYVRTQMQEVGAVLAGLGKKNVAPAGPAPGAAVERRGAADDGGIESRATSTAAVIAVTVDFPCVPATASTLGCAARVVRLSRPSISG